MAARRSPFVIATLLGIPSVALAQLDYRNLDDDRPTLIEDAYPLERYGFEILAPWRYSRAQGGGGVLEVEGGGAAGERDRYRFGRGYRRCWVAHISSSLIACVLRVSSRAASGPVATRIFHFTFSPPVSSMSSL